MAEWAPIEYAEYYEAECCSCGWDGTEHELIDRGNLVFVCPYCGSSDIDYFPVPEAGEYY
jgi:predicted RNA-binding Zn-ribbon protein involved in translation (DUF1610 family)